MGKIIVALRSTPSKYDCDFSEMEYKMLALKKRSFEGGFGLQYESLLREYVI